MAPLRSAAKNWSLLFLGLQRRKAPISVMWLYNNTVLLVNSRGSKNQFTIIELASTEVLTSEITAYLNWDQSFYKNLVSLKRHNKRQHGPRAGRVIREDPKDIILLVCHIEGPTVKSQRALLSRGESTEGTIVYVLCRKGKHLYQSRDSLLSFPPTLFCKVFRSSYLIPLGPSSVSEYIMIPTKLVRSISFDHTIIYRLKYTIQLTTFWLREILHQDVVQLTQLQGGSVPWSTLTPRDAKIVFSRVSPLLLGKNCGLQFLWQRRNCARLQWWGGERGRRKYCVIIIRCQIPVTGSWVNCIGLGASFFFLKPRFELENFWTYQHVTLKAMALGSYNSSRWRNLPCGG